MRVRRRTEELQMIKSRERGLTVTKITCIFTALELIESGPTWYEMDEEVVGVPLSPYLDISFETSCRYFCLAVYCLPIVGKHVPN